MCTNIDVTEVNTIARSAGDLIMEIYKKDFSVEYKDDKSPLTEADKRANDYICAELNRITPDIPILSEENKEIPYEERKNWDCFWLVDPLDGTKEFIKKNDEFTVNIALIDNGNPVMGVVYAPALKKLFYAKQYEGAFCTYENGETFRLPLEKQQPENKLRVVASRSHMSDETRVFIEDLNTKETEVELVSVGSSLKICLVAEGSADIYPRLGPTMEWDTGAAHAVVNESVGKVTQYESSKQIQYNKQELLNPWFIVRGKAFQ